MTERLQKVLAQAGIASRRKAEEMILEGRVRVNGEVVLELGTKVDPEHDGILADGQPVHLEHHVYLVLNKPRGYVSDMDETADRPSALELVNFPERLFPAGRLDWNSEGLLFLTNDGELAYQLTHPKFEHQKEYLVLVKGRMDILDLKHLESGISSEGEWLKADRARTLGRHQPFGEASRDETWLSIILHEGKKRHIRRMCAAIGHPVRRLIRIRIGPLRLGQLPIGKWRRLTEEELAQLRSSLKPARQSARKSTSRSIRKTK